MDFFLSWLVIVVFDSAREKESETCEWRRKELIEVNEAGANLSVNMLLMC